MHAYKDAIRRTAGAYILYPGTENKIWKGYHEIIPGLGAFTLRPTKGDEGSVELQEFLENVLDQLLNRASKYEEITYHIFETQSAPSVTVREALPEKYANKRMKPPVDVRCLIGYVKGKKHKQWIEDTGFYNIRLTARDDEDEAERARLDFFGLTYLVLHDENGLVTSQLYDIVDPQPIVMSRHELTEKGYPNPRHDQYLVFSVKPNRHSAFQGVKWDLSKLEEIPVGRPTTRPFVTSLVKLMSISTKVDEPEGISFE